MRAATRSTTTGRIPLSSDYVIEARLNSDEGEEEEEVEGKEGKEGGDLKGVKLEGLAIGEQTPLL